MLSNLGVSSADIDTAITHELYRVDGQPSELYAYVLVPELAIAKRIVEQAEKEARARSRTPVVHYARHPRRLGDEVLAQKNATTTPYNPAPTRHPRRPSRWGLVPSEDRMEVDQDAGHPVMSGESETMGPTLEATGQSAARQASTSMQEDDSSEQRPGTTNKSSDEAATSGGQQRAASTAEGQTLGATFRGMSRDLTLMNQKGKKSDRAQEDAAETGHIDQEATADDDGNWILVGPKGKASKGKSGKRKNSSGLSSQHQPTVSGPGRSSAGTRSPLPARKKGTDSAGQRIVTQAQTPPSRLKSRATPLAAAQVDSPATVRRREQGEARKREQAEPETAQGDASPTCCRTPPSRPPTPTLELSDDDESVMTHRQLQQYAEGTEGSQQPHSEEEGSQGFGLSPDVRAESL
jgi:hypothetical protein